MNEALSCSVSQHFLFVLFGTFQGATKNIFTAETVHSSLTSSII